MLRKVTTLVAAAALAAGALAASPATAAEADFAMSACQVKPLFSVIEYNQTVAIAGVYNAPAGAIDAELTCGVVRYGRTYAKQTDLLVGPVAALAATAVVPAGNVSSCYEIRVQYVDHATWTDTCP